MSKPDDEWPDKLWWLICQECRWGEGNGER